MAKITLKNFDELIVTEDEAVRVKELKDGPESLIPIIITHSDGVWSGSAKDISSFSLEKKQNTFFLTEENKHRFHTQHGYGKYTPYYEPGYGMLSVETQFLIGAKLAELYTDEYNRKHLRMLQSEHHRKYAELWEDYLTKLDAFNDLK